MFLPYLEQGPGLELIVLTWCEQHSYCEPCSLFWFSPPGPTYLTPLVAQAVIFKGNIREGSRQCLICGLVVRALG